MSAFKWRHFAGEVILWAVRWYCRYGISYRELEEMLAERGVEVDHTTLYRWTQRYAPELEKRTAWYRSRLSFSWRVDETYVRVKGRWKYLYRAIDKDGATLDFYAHRPAQHQGGPSAVAPGALHQPPVRPPSLSSQAATGPHAFRRSLQRRRYARARVSTDDQDLRLQRAALKEAGCRRIYEEKVSGARRDRPQLARLLDQVREDDVVVVYRLDRLARSTRDLLEIAEQLREAGAGLRSLGEPWADTTSPAGRMVLTVFAGIAEFERALIQERTGAGRAAAMRRGVRFGRPAKLAADQVALAQRLLEEGTAGRRGGADVQGPSRHPLSRADGGPVFRRKRRQSRFSSRL